LSGPEDIAIDPIRNEIFVANFVSDAINVYSRAANGDVAPLREVSGDETELSGEFGLALCTSPEIPTLAEWAQLGMAALLLGGGLWALRRRPGLRLRRRLGSV
jgi:hypothetical protein